MNLLPVFASTSSSNIADLFTKSLPVSTTHHQFSQLVIGDILPPPPPRTSVVTATDDTAPTAVSTSNSIPTLHPNSTSVPTPLVLDTGVSFPIIPFPSDFISASQASSGLIRTSSTVVSTPVDPYTLITGEDTATATDLSSPDTTDSDSGPCFELLSDLSALASHLQSRRRYHLEVFGTATLTLSQEPQDLFSFSEADKSFDYQGY